MSAANFPGALSVVLQYEGGYVDDPRDPGGCTNLGVTLSTLQDWRGDSCSPADVRQLSPASVSPLYRARYWDAVRADALPAGVDLICFDGAVNQGPGEMARLLQRAAGVDEDGEIGPATLAAVGRVVPMMMVERVRTARLAAYKADGDWGAFWKGWTNRLNGVAHTATSWAVKSKEAA